MPEKTDQPVDRPPVQADRVVNVILSGDDKIYYYFGLADSKKPPLPELIKTDYSKDGFRKILLKRNHKVSKKVFELEEQNTKGVLKMTPEYLNYRIAELKKLEKEGKAVSADINKKIVEIQDQYKTDDKDMKRAFLEWRKKDIKKNEDKNSPIILIKADEKAKYKNIVDIIDEMYICSIPGYAVVDLSDDEKEMMKNAPK